MASSRGRYLALARRFRTIESAAAAGILHSICVIVSLNLLLALPPISASQDEIRAYYAEGAFVGRARLALILGVFGVIGFIWFVAVIRHRIGEQEPKFFATVFLGGAIIYCALFLVGSSAMAAPAILIEFGEQIPDPGAAAIARAIGVGILGVALPRVQALVVFSAAGLGRLTGALPRWLVAVSGLFGLGLLLLVTFFQPGFYGFPIWVAVVSVVILIRPKSRPAFESTA